MEIILGILKGIGGFFAGIPQAIADVFTLTSNVGQIYTAFARWIFILLALFILLTSIRSLLKSRNPSEVWAYLNIGDYMNVPLRHWENVIGRARSCDIQIDDMSVSRNHGTLTRDNSGVWKYMDLGSKNGASVNGRRVRPNAEVQLKAGDRLQLGGAVCTLFPISIEERRNNIQFRQEDTVVASPWPSLVALTVFQIMTVIQLMIGLGEKYNAQITISFLGICVLMWIYVLLLRGMKRRGFEMETIAFFLSTLSLAVTATCLPNQVFKQFITVVMGVVLFFFMCTWLRDLPRTIALKKVMYVAAVLLLLFNVFFGTTKNGASNWVQLGGLTIQPSEIVKLAFIWVGAASLDELFRRRNTLYFTIFAVFCFGCLAAMSDFGTAMIFFVIFLIISFLRSGDFTKLIVILGVTFAGGLMILKFASASYVASRFAVWGHAWDPEFISNTGFQMTRAMTAAASGGFVGLGAGEGWLNGIIASETDLVFCVVTEEWGLLIALLAVAAIVTLSVFAYRSILAGRSTYYTIAACSAMAIFLMQTSLNVLGSVNLLPLTGVAFPFLSTGGTSMIASWGLLAFLKAADTRQNASIAVSLKDKGLGEEVDEI